MIEIYRSGTLTVWAGITNEGLAIDGQDLGGHPSTDEYEYFIRVAPEHFPLLRGALGGRQDDDLVALVAANAGRLVRTGETTWLKSHGIPYTLDTRLG